MSVELTEWGNEIWPHIMGLPSPALKTAVRHAAIDFCKQTLLWEYTLDRIDVEADESDYTLTIPTAQYALLSGLVKVKYKEDGADDDQFTRLTITSETELEAQYSGPWQFYEATVPSKVWMDNVNKQLHLVPIPTEDSSEGLLVKVSLKPSDTSLVVPDFLYNGYKDEIANGTLAYLLSLKNTPWYDQGLSMEFKNSFKYGCDNASMKRVTGPTNRPMQVRMRRF